MEQSRFLLQVYEMFTRIDILPDTGSGIPENEQAKIFSRFYRSNAVQNKKGLASAYTLPDRIISGEKAAISRLLPFRKYVFHICRNNNSIKTVDFIFCRKECGKNLMR